MALTKAGLSVQFSGGVDLRTDPKQVAAAQLIDLQNAVFTRQTTLSKRNGYRALSTAIQSGGGNYTGAVGLALRDEERLLFNGKRCYSYRPSSDSWADAGEVAATTATTIPIARTGTYQTQPDIAERNGVRVVAWEDSRGGVWCSVLEATTSRVLLSQTQLDSSALAQNPRCVACGEAIHVLWTRTDLFSIQIAVINPSIPANAPTATTLVSDLDNTKPFFDAMSTPNGDSGAFVTRPALIAWATMGGGFRVGWISPAGAIGSPLYGIGSAATFTDVITGPIAVAWDGTTTTAAVLWCSGGTTVAGRFLAGSNLTSVTRSAAALGANSAAFTRLACAFGATGTDNRPALYWAAEAGTTRSDQTTVDAGAALQTASTLDAVSTRLRGHGLVSRAWHDGATLLPTATTQDGDVYVLAAHTAQFFPYVAALRISAASGIASPSSTIVARLMPGESAGSLMRPTGAGTRAWTQHLPSVMPVGLDDANLFSRQHAACVPYRIQLSSQNGDQFSEQGIKLATLNFDAGYQSAQLGRGLYLASAAPMHYDGEQWREADFHCAPDLGYDSAGVPVGIGTSAVIGGAGSIPNGSYLYAYWYEAVDAQGELHRGAVSAKLMATMTGGPKAFNLTIPTCRLTRFPNVRICVARSEQGATGTDSTIPLYKVTSNDVTVTTGANRYVTNDPTADTVAFVDAIDDATLITREPLYTNGGILSNEPAPWGGGVIAVSKSRLIWTDSTDPNVFRYSQQIADDTALEAPTGLSGRCDPLGGDITAIGVMDDAFYPFKETAIFVVGGPGPLADPTVSPESNAFTQPELVTADVGCTSPASIGQTPLGITFQSRKGIKLLSRSRSILDIGNPVEPLKDQRYTRTTLLPDRKAILYLTDTPDGYSLLWDYNRDQWSKFSNHLGLDAFVVDDVYHYLRTDGRVFQETIGPYADDNARIPLRIETSWLRFLSYLQGWQKILYAYFLGKYLSAHTLRLRYRLDFNDAYSAPIDLNVNANYNPSLYGAGSYGVGAYGGSGSDNTRYQRAVHINRRCQAISFLIEDVEATGDFGASFELAELLLIGGGIGTDFPVGAARSS